MADVNIAPVEPEGARDETMLAADRFLRILTGATRGPRDPDLDLAKLLLRLGDASAEQTRAVLASLISDEDPH